MKHSSIRNLLYEYAQNELTERDRISVEEHLSSCTRCAEELGELRKTLALLPSPSHRPSDERSEAFWNSLVLRVGQEIGRQPGRGRFKLAGLRDRLATVVALRPGYAFAAAGSFAALVLAVVLFRIQPNEHAQIAEQSSRLDDSSYVLADDNVQERVGDYFRKSKALLIGIANMKTTDGVDLSAEQMVSRRLVHEARYLKHQPLDLRAAKLVNDLEKILIELANIEQNSDLPNVEMIRTGIHQENLLFRIRMAAASYDSTERSRRIY